MLFICVNAASASDTLDTNLTSEDTADTLSVDAVNSTQDKLSSSGDTYVVDQNGGGQYTTISDAVSAAAGGETIFVKNGDYSEANTITFTKSVSIIGESQDGVKITGAAKTLFGATTDSALTLSFVNLTILNAGSGSNPAVKLTYIGHDLSLINCTFNNCGSKYGTIQLGHPGPTLIDSCKILNSKETTSAGSGAIYLSGAGETTIKNTIIDNVQYTVSSSYMNGAIYVYNTNAILNIENTVISNVTAPTRGIINTVGTVNIKGSKIKDNSLSQYSTTMTNHLIYIGDKGTVNIEQTMIVNNTCVDQLFNNYKDTSKLMVNYCNIQDNTASGTVNNLGTIDLEANYWGSNDKPADVTATTWVVENNGEYTLNTGDALDKIIPGVNEEPEDEPIVLPEGTIYVSPTGNDTNDGLSEANAIATIAHAVEIAKAKENKTSTIYLLNGEYSTPAIDVTEVNLTFIGQEKGKVVIHGTGKYIIDVYGDHLISKFENIDFVDSCSPSGNMGALRLYADYSDFTINNCNFRNISAKYGALDLQGDYGTVNINNCVVEDVTGSTSMSAIVYINVAETTVNFDNIEISNCRLDEKYSSENPTNYLRAIFYVASKSATVTLTNSRITDNYGAMYGGVIESKSKLTVENTIIRDNVVNTSYNGNNGGQYLIWASDDKADIIMSNCVITENTIVKSGYGLFYNQKGKINVEYSDISKNTVDKFIGSTGTITANNNWWGTNDQPDAKVDKWVIMNVLLDDSDLSENNKITLTIDFNHVKTSSGLEELTGGEIPKDSYSIDLSAKNGEITPANVVVNKGQTLTQTFTVTELNDEITLTCDGDEVTIIIEAIPPYRGIIYVNATGSDDSNEGSIDAPVATIAKAIELANKGSHEIIINEGTYVGCNYTVTDDLTITGNGKVTLDANSEGGFFATGYPTDATKIELSNLILVNAKGSTRAGSGCAINSYASEVILNNVTIVNSQASGYLIKSNGKLTIKDSTIANSMSGDVIQQSGSGDIIINNTVFENNLITDTTSVYGVIYISSGSGNLVIEDSQFINNTARQGVIRINYNYNIEVKGSTFVDNTNTVSYGGAIYAYGSTLTVTDSTFINNKAAKDGGAIYVSSRTTATVDKSIFINNSVTDYGYHGDAIYNGKKLTVNNCVLLTNANNFIIFNDGEDDVVNAQNNWWGTNDNPKNLVASGEYEDYWDDETYPCPEVDVSNWVKMSASYDPSLVVPGDEVTVTATFDNVNLPDGIEVTFTSTSGLNTVVLSKDAKATLAYTIAANDEAINATSSNAVIEMPIAYKVQSIVTNDTFYNFFDEDGFLKDSVEANELVFEGEFSDLAAGYIIIHKPISIVGKNALLNNMGIMILSEDVAIDNLTLVADTSLGDLISVTESNVDLTNLNITYIVDDEMANAISVKGDTIAKISNVNILNNSIYFESHVITDEDLTTAINLEKVEDVIVDGNTIVANIPALSVETYDYTYFMMGLCYVNPIRIYEAESVELTNNKVDVTVNDFDSSYPTVQALYIVGSEDVLVKGNNFTMRDTLTPIGTAIYLYAVECGFSSGIQFIENNFDILTTGGKSGAGSAYALQIATSDAVVIGNNITCDSNGPNLGIYLPMGFGPAKDLLAKDNFINVTGYAAGTSSYALVSGIEVQTGYATIYNNTIYVQNKAAYNEKYPVAGISAVQSSAKTLSFDIQDNEIYTNGKYTVDIRYAPTVGIVTGNYLLSYDLQGDNSVYFKSGNNNRVENNMPTNVVTNDTFYDFFDNEGVLNTTMFKELIFNGTFAGLTDSIVINVPISIVGIDAVLNDICVKIISDNVKISDLTLNSNNKEFADNYGALIYATGSDIEINGVKVNYAAPSDVEAIGIYANAANNFKLFNSEIAYVSTNPGSKHNYGLEVRGSENVSIENNIINATLPAVDVNYGAMGSIDSDLVLAVGIQGGKNINFTRNAVNVNTNGGIGYYPTIDAIMIYGVDNVLVNLNNITHIDVTTSDTARYYYSVDIYSSTAVVDGNNILVNTTSGIVRTGAAYPIQLTGPFTVVVSNNNLTSISRGPNAGIYASNWGGYGDLTVNDNNIDIIGYATAGGYSLVAGIEAEIDITRVYDNVIIVANLADYDDTNPVYGVSIAPSAYLSQATADIRWNNITVDGKYAVYYKTATNSNITFNELLAHELEGDAAAFIESGDNNYILVNFPPYLAQIIIDADDIWIGSDNTINVTVVGATGNVTIKVNEKEFKDLVLVNGSVSQIVSAADLVAGANEVTVTFTSTIESIRPGSENATFYVLDGVVTQDTYLLYFNQEDNGKLFDYIPEGATLDFQGSIINPDTNIVVQMNVNKPVNIVSTTGDAYVDLNTTAGSLLGESPGNSFAVTNGGSGSNITGIYLHNTQLWIANTHNVVLDNISVVVEDQRVGSGVGATSIRENSSYVVLKNSYLYTRNNGGSTTFTMSWADHCTIDNCTVKAEGNVGNLIYLNIFNIAGAPSGVPLNNYNTVSNNRIYGKEGSAISVGLMVEGQYNLIVNNTLYKSSISTSFGGANPYNNTYVGNVMTEGGSLSAQAGSIVYNNNVTGTLTTGKESKVYNNIVGKYMSVTAGNTLVYNNTVATYMSVGADAVAYENIVGTYMSVAARAVAYNNTVGTYVTVAANGVVHDNDIGTTLTINGKDAVVENNTIGGAVTIAKAATGIRFIGNEILATVTVNSNNNIIRQNNITTTGDYAIDLKTSSNNVVTDNVLHAKLAIGDDAVSYDSANNNTVENNLPINVDAIIEVGNIWYGTENIAYVTVTNSDGALATGSVTFKINGKSYTVDLVEGKANCTLHSEDIVAGENELVVDYVSDSISYDSFSNSTTFVALDGIVTQDTYLLYFNQEDNGKLFDYIPEGATLDFQGSIINPDTNIVVQMNVNKPVNIVSTTGDAYVDLNTTAGSLLGESPGNSFAVTNGGSGSNITGIYLHNTQLWIANTHNVVLDNISVVVEDQRVGSGVGATSIRENSSYVVLKNSYLYTRNNGGSTTFTMSWADHCTIDNCTVKAEGNVGNLIYLNIFNIAGAPSGVPLNNYNTVSNNRIYGKEGSAISVGLMVEGQYNLIVNNTLYKSSISTSFGSINPYGNIYVGNTMTEGSGLTAQIGSIVYGNNVTGTLSTGKESTVYNNIVGKLTVGESAIVYDNTVGTTATISGKNADVENNTIGGAVTISGAGVTFVGNDVSNTVTVNSNNNVIKENSITSTGTYAIDLKTKTGNTVEENELIASSLIGDKAVNGNVNNNIIKNNYPNENGLSVSVDDIKVGETAVVNVSIYYSATGTVKVIIDGKVYDVPIDNGAAILELTDLKANDYDVRVIYDGDKYVTAGENFTSFTVSKYKSDAIITTSDIAVRTDVDVNVAIANATGDVTVIVDGNTLVLPLNDGVATFTIPSITAGEHTIRVSYLGDDKVEMVSNSTTFTVDRMPTSINVSSAEIYVGQTAEVTISFSEKIDADVLVEIDGKKTYVQLTNGTATLSYGTLAAGTYDISVTFAADDYFDSSSATGQIIVNKMDAGLNADASDVDAGSDAIINVEIDAWAIGDVNIIIDGQSIPVIFTNGKASVHIPGLAEGNYTALVKFEGDDRFNADETNVTFKVSKVQIDDINVDASVVKGTTDTQFKVTLPSDATGTVTVTIGDKSVDDTLTNGKVAIAINDVTPGSYNVTVSYTGDDKYTAAEKTVPMTVDKLDAGLKATTDDIYVGEDAIISITINRAVTGNVNVYLGDQIIQVTINNGRGSATISGLSNGTYTATVRFANDDKFGDDEKEVTFTVYKYDLDTLNVVVDVPQETLDPEFSVTLPSDATGTITVTIDGKNATGTLTNGEVTVIVNNVTPGFYDDAIVSYSGDNKYEALQETVLVIVDKLDAGLEASADDIKVGENATISIEINEDVTGDVRIEFGNEVIPVTIVDGEASVEISGLPEGTYTALVKFIGDSIFDEDEIEVIFTVSKEDSSSEANLTIDIPEGTTSPKITIEMPSDATGNLTVIIDDETYTSELVNGAATVKVPELVPGTYDDVVVAYTGDDKYSPMFNTTSIVVPKLDAGLKATSNDISLGEDAIIIIEIDSRATGTVSVFIGDAVIPVTLDNGKADVSVPGLGLGNHTAVVKFEGDILFNASEVDVNISVSKDEIPENSTEPSMDIPDETTAPEFTINLPEDATGNFTVTVDGENYTAEVVNGTATVKVPDLTVGNHTIFTAYSGDDKYDGYTTPAKPVDIPKAKISGGDSALDPKTPAGSSSPSYSINLPSDATGNLTVTVDGVNHTQALVNGSATVILHNLTEGNHNITVAYTGDAKYSNISKTSVYNVKVPVVKITNNKDVTMLYSAKTPYKVLVTVDGKAVGAGETVSMTFNGVTYKVQTDKNGYATLKLPDVKPKNAKYTITAEYKGVKVSNKVKVNSIVKAKNVKVKKSKKVNKIKVTLKKVNGKFLKGKKITLKIKGKKITAKTNKKGVATFKVKKNVLKKLKVGKKYKYTVTYGKDVVTKKLTVKK